MSRSTEIASVFAAAVVVTMVIAAPVLRAPSERVFGMELVGRHHDPFTVMEQFAGPIHLGMYSQPVTDLEGAFLERIAGPVASYNWLVLLSFPLSAVAAYALARYLALQLPGAALAAMAYAFSPFHLAHAAYHPQIAQTQWMPLYLLALWWCVDAATPLAVCGLAAAALGVTLSNFYGGLIAIVITPVAVAAYWLATYRRGARPVRRLGVTVASLLLMAAAGIAYVRYAAAAVAANPSAFAFTRGDLFLYSAKWWSYLIPPVEQPFLGAAAHRFWIAAGIHDGLLEQQVALGWGIIALGLIAIVRWRGPRSDTPVTADRYIPVLIAIAIAALVCSLSPERTIGTFRFVRPSAWLYTVVPMFRSYARFGVLVQLMAALLAGIGVDRLLRAGTIPTRLLCAALVALAVCEYAVSPVTLSRDALPTAAHRWIMREPGRVLALDCVPLDPESASVRWLTGSRVALLDGSIDRCADADLARKLSASGYTYLLVRRDTDEGRWFATHPAPDGLRIAERFDDAWLFAVPARTPIAMDTTR